MNLPTLSSDTVSPGVKTGKKPSRKTLSVVTSEL